MMKIKMNNKGFTLVELLSIIVIISFIAAFSFSVVTKKIKESKEKLYDSLINDIEEAGKKYMLQQETSLDQYHTNTLCITIEQLQNAGHLEKGEIKNPKNNEVLSGFVQIQYDDNNNQYRYTYVDTCTPVSITPAFQTILDNENLKVINSTDGLYETSDSYVFKGTNPNNYIRFNSSLWRIVSIDKETNMVKIINLNGSQQTWQENGMIEYLNNDYTNGSTYSDETKNLINNNSKWNAGKLDKIDSILSLKSQEKQVKEYHTIGLLNVSEYIDASLVNDCYLTNNCTSYLSKNSNYYLYNNTNDNKVWYVGSDNKLNTISPTSETLYNLYPVLNLKLKTNISNGDGTELSPYEL